MPEASTIERPAPPADTRPTTASQKILIIDDEAGIRDSLETLLLLEGFHVDLAVDQSMQP